MSNALNGVEIFAAGTWNGSSFSTDDLDGIVRSFEFFNQSGRVPLKLGHNDEQGVTDGQPALGWVTRVWRDGKKLMADFADMPSVVYDAIRKGLYKFVSVELLRDVQADTKVVPLVLDAVALLGADLPAVGTLRDLQALTMSALRGQSRERLAFTRALNYGVNTSMADDNTEELERLRRQAEALQRDLALAKAEAVQNKEHFTRLEAETKKQKVEAHRKDLLDLLETAVRTKQIQASARERFLRFSKIETDDEACMRVPRSDVESYIRENPNPFIQRPATGAGANPDEVPVGGLPDRELFARARKLCREWGKNPENWQDLKAAGVAVMRSDPALAERYRVLPDDHADGKYAA